MYQYKNQAINSDVKVSIKGKTQQHKSLFTVSTRAKATENIKNSIF